MPQRALLDQLLNSFPKSNKEDWCRAASKEISGKNPLENLTWKSSDELVFLPYYDADGAVSRKYLERFDLKASSSVDSRAWKCIPKISLDGVKDANAVALNHLAGGADGILFDLGDSNEYDLNTLLTEIHWPYCSVSFSATHLTNLIQDITEFVRKKKYDPELLAGTIFCKSPRDINSRDLTQFDTFRQFRVLGIEIPIATAVKEISTALVNAVSLLDTLTDAGLAKEFVWRNISFSLVSGKNFLLDIAKLKALRILLYQLNKAFEIKGDTEPEINIRIEPFRDERYNPHGNMISSTVSAIAAIAGGCNSLTIVPEHDNNSTMTRIARNVSNILREESHLDKVADPTAGAYAIESMIDQLAAAAWEDFQRNVTHI